MDSAILPGSAREFPVDARELHANLGLTMDFSDWIKATIERFGFFSGEDFIGSRSTGNQTGRGGDRRSYDYRLTQNAAKRIQIAAKGEAGDAAREGAVKLHDHVEAAGRMPAVNLRDPKQLAALALQLTQIVAEKDERIAEQSQALALAAPKVEAFDACMSSEDLLTIAAVSNIVARPGHPMGEVRLFRALREMGILQHNNRPYQEHIDAKRFVVRETSWTGNDGTTHVKCQTLATTRGVEYVRRRLDDVRGQRSLLPAKAVRQ